MSRFLPVMCCAAILLALAAVGSGESWLDRPLSNWNQASARLPDAPESSANLATRCKAHSRAPENLADQALFGAGWLPFGSLQTYGRTLIITAMSDADPSCNPTRYQAFVFSDGKVAGTLSPVLMNFSRDGSIRNARLLNDGEIEIDYMHGGSVSSVRFVIKPNSIAPVLTPVEVKHAQTTAPPPVTGADPAPMPSAPSSPVSAPVQEAQARPASPAAVRDAIRPPPPPQPAEKTQVESRFLRPVQNESILKGCGCFLALNGRYLLVTQIVDRRAWINFNGKDTPLRLVRSTLPKGKEKLRPGSQFREEYVTSDVRATVDYTVKQLSGTDSFSEYDATILLAAGESQEVLHTSCRCGCMK